MQRLGFIHDMMDVKVLILFVASKALYPLSLQKIYELCFQDDCLSYFDVSVAVPQMVESGHLEKTGEDEYVITDKGRKNSNICESSLPYSVRQLSDRHIAAYNKEVLRRQQAQSHVTQRENGTYTVTLKLRDDVDSLMELELMVADKESGQALAERFQREPEKVYGQIIGLLCRK